MNRVWNKRSPLAKGVYVGRPTKFGNPFVIGKDGTRADVVAKFEALIRSQPELMEAAKRELRGKDLICWCAPAACHADVLMRIANEPASGVGASDDETEIPVGTGPIQLTMARKDYEALPESLPSIDWGEVDEELLQIIRRWYAAENVDMTIGARQMMSDLRALLRKVSGQ